MSNLYSTRVQRQQAALQPRRTNAYQPLQRPGGIQSRQPLAPVQRLTESDIATVYGCCGVFDMCSDRDLMSLSFQGSDPFLDWVGWQATDVCVIKKNFITYMRPQYTDGTPTVGYASDPCAPANSVEWGTCDFTLEDFARIRRAGPVRDLTKTTMRMCEIQPRYRLDGTMINNDLEYDSVIATEVLLQDIRNMVITGNAATPGMADGLERLVRNGYVDSQGRTCQAMDSIVIDWNSNTMDGGAGITWNGAAISATANFVDVLRATIRRVWQRIKMAPALQAQQPRMGDQILLLPDFLAQCLLNAYTCWSVCPGAQFNEANINTLDARAFRDNLNGGLFGAGRIFIDGVEIPLLTYDWSLIKGPTHGDIYFLTGSWGALKLIQGQYLNMNPIVQQRPRSYWATDGGRLLHWSEQDETCDKHTVEMRPRWLSWAPWAQVRFQDVQCSVPGGPLSPDPLETSFFPTQSFLGAECV